MRSSNNCLESWGSPSRLSMHPCGVCGSKSRPRNTLHLYFRAPAPTQARVYMHSRVYLLRLDNRVYEKWAAWTLHFPKHIPAPSSTTRKHRLFWSVSGYQALTLQKQSFHRRQTGCGANNAGQTLNLKRTDGFDDDDVPRPKGLLFLPFLSLPKKKRKPDPCCIGLSTQCLADLSDA